MDAMQIAIPVVGIVAAAVATFYIVSFSEIREKSFRDLEDSESKDGGGFELGMSSRKKRAMRKSGKQPPRF